MRYRFKTYNIKWIAGNVFAVQIPTIPVTLPSDTTEATAVVREAIRLIVDETAHVVYCSSMKKDNLNSVVFTETGYAITMVFTAPAGKISGIATHEFTIEFDFGEVPVVGSDLTAIKTEINSHTDTAKAAIIVNEATERAAINAHTTTQREKIMGGEDITPDAEGKFLVGMAFNPNYYSFYDDGQYFRIDYSSSDYVEGELGDILRKLPNPGYDNGYVIVGVKPGVDPTGADIQDIENCIRSDGGDGLTEFFDFAECTPGLWKVKSVLEIDGYNLMLYVYERVPEPRSVREVYEKLEEIDMTAAQNLASFFNITEATEYTALTPAEAIAIARDCQYNVMGTDWPIPTWLPTGVTEAQVESAAEGLGIPYHEPTQTA